MESCKKTFIATASELKTSPLYMTIKTPMFTTPSPNLNGVRCTEGFLDQIIANENDYIGLPLNADVKNLCAGRYKSLGHMYDPNTGEFSSTMIGSFYKFEKEQINDEQTALIGYSRVSKRNKAICKAIAELFAQNALKFSFEITAGTYDELEDGTLVIDAAENNKLEGMAIVSFPACPDAVAEQLVAQINGVAGKEASAMVTNEEEKVVVAEEEEHDEEVVVAEELNEEEHPEQTEIAEEANVEEEHVEASAENEDAPIVNAEEDKDDGEEDKEDDKEDEEDECAECKKKKACAEDDNVVAEDKTSDIIAELKTMIEDLKSQIAELKAAKVVVAERQEEEINPFTDEISAPVKYTLLESDKQTTKAYTLL